MKLAATLLAALMLAGCNSPGVLKSLPFPEVLPVQCADGHYRVRNPVTHAPACP